MKKPNWNDCLAVMEKTFKNIESKGFSVGVFDIDEKELKIFITPLR